MVVDTMRWIERWCTRRGWLSGDPDFLNTDRHILLGHAGYKVQETTCGYITWKDLMCFGGRCDSGEPGEQLRKIRDERGDFFASLNQLIPWFRDQVRTARRIRTTGTAGTTGHRTTGPQGTQDHRTTGPQDYRTTDTGTTGLQGLQDWGLQTTGAAEIPAWSACAPEDYRGQTDVSLAIGGEAPGLLWLEAPREARAREGQKWKVITYDEGCGICATVPIHREFGIPGHVALVSSQLG